MIEPKRINIREKVTKPILINQFVWTHCASDDVPMLSDDNLFIEIRQRFLVKNKNIVQAIQIL